MDEARAFYAERYMPIVLEDRGGREAFHWRVSQRTFGPIGVLKSEIASSVRAIAQPVDGYYCVNRAVSGGVELTHAGGVVNVGAGSEGMVTSPSVPARVDFKAGHAGIQVSIPRTLFESEAEALVGRPLTRPLVFSPRLDGAIADPVMRMLDFIIAEAPREASALVAARVGERLAQALILTLLRFQQHDQVDLMATDGGVAPSRSVKRAQEFMTARSNGTITSADLFAATGVGMRALQRGFRRHHGTTPSAFLRARRLDVARASLIASPWKTITEVALACGFAHVGRFSTYYRARFGESPSETRARAR